MKKVFFALVAVTVIVLSACNNKPKETMDTVTAVDSTVTQAAQTTAAAVDTAAAAVSSAAASVDSAVSK